MKYSVIGTIMLVVLSGCASDGYNFDDFVNEYGSYEQQPEQGTKYGYGQIIGTNRYGYGWGYITRDGRLSVYRPDGEQNARSDERRDRRDERRDRRDDRRDRRDDRRQN